MGVKNDTFWFEIWSGFEESGGTPPLRIPRGTSPGDVSRTKRAALLQRCRMTSRSATKELQKGWLQQ